VPDRCQRLSPGIPTALESSALRQEHEHEQREHHQGNDCDPDRGRRRPGTQPRDSRAHRARLREGYRVLGIRRGWAGIVELERDKGKPHEDHVIELSEEAVNKVGRTGGTFLHTSRTNPSKVTRRSSRRTSGTSTGRHRDVTPTYLPPRVARRGHPDPIGGDDTLSYGVRLTKEACESSRSQRRWTTTAGHDYCIGFSTCGDCARSR